MASDKTDRHIDAVNDQNQQHNQAQQQPRLPASLAQLAPIAPEGHRPSRQQTQQGPSDRPVPEGHDAGGHAGQKTGQPIRDKGAAQGQRRRQQQKAQTHHHRHQGRQQQGEGTGTSLQGQEVGLTEAPQPPQRRLQRRPPPLHRAAAVRGGLGRTTMGGTLGQTSSRAISMMPAEAVQSERWPVRSAAAGRCGPTAACRVGWFAPVAAIPWGSGWPIRVGGPRRAGAGAGASGAGCSGLA